MLHYLPTIILRHRKENLKKCSLRGLEARSDCLFFTYPKEAVPDVSNYLLLTPDAPPLTNLDAPLGLLLIDGTWRYAEVMSRHIPPTYSKRSIPSQFKTAYPRRQEVVSGLASIEALYIAFHIKGLPTEGLLDNYYWKNDFLKLNSHLFHVY